MDDKELERHLEAGQRWGFIKPTDDAEYLGWVLIRKRKPRVAPAFEPAEKPERYAQYLSEVTEMLRTPYHMSILELKRDVHDRGNYETNEDYRMRENHFFSTLDAATAFIESLGFRIYEIRPAFELDAP